VVGPHPCNALGRRAGTVAAAGAGVAYALGATFTHPFTVPADVITAVPVAVAAALTARTIRRPRAESDTAVAGAARSGRWNRWWLVWSAAVAAVAAWELSCYVALPREQHPTLSVLLDMLDSTRVGKTVAFTSWLALGWYLVSR